MAYVLHQDALEFLKDLPSGSVDLAISSPPYFMGKEYDRSCSLADFVDIHEQILWQLVRVLRLGGSVCWQVGHHVRDNEVVPLDAIVYNVFARASELKLRNRIVWTFGHGVHCHKRFSGRHESILWFSKGDDYYFDLNAVRVRQKYPGKKHYKGPKQGQPSGNRLGKNPGDVWDIPNVKACHVEKTDHPCQFPVALVQRLVKALSPPNGLVIDPFVGSGSSGVAALLESRQFRGSDINKKYVMIARERLSDAESGRAIIRPLDQPIHVPSKTDAVARMPAEWLNGIWLDDAFVIAGEESQ